MERLDVSDSKMAPDEGTHTPNDKTRLSMKFYKFTIQINKHMLLIKACLFLLFGAGSFMMPFVTVLYRQRGVTLSELSAMFILTPLLQILVGFVQGAIADRIGTAKPIFHFNILFTISIVVCWVFLPSMAPEACQIRPINVTCQPLSCQLPTTNMTCQTIRWDSTCDQEDGFLDVHSCKLLSSEGYGYMRNFSLSMDVSSSISRGVECVSDVRVVNDSSSWCDFEEPISASCMFNECPPGGNSRGVVLVLYIILYVMYLVTYTNCYRMMDITVMSLVKEHDGDYGHERCFAIGGILIMSPLAGYLVQLTTPAGQPNNYLTALYLNIALHLLLAVLMWNVKVTIKERGQTIGRKMLSLLKNPDVIMFMVMLLVLGTCWNFAKYFTYWYLSGIGASDVLLGIHPAIGSLYGIPFLFTSGFFVKKIGTKNLFLLSHAAYVVTFVAYSFVVNTWVSLAIEVTNILSYHLFWVAVMEYTLEVASSDITSLVITASGALHFSGGKLTVGLTGGQIMNYFGGRVAYRVMAVVCLVSGVLSGIYYLYRKKKNSVKSAR